MSNYSQLLQNVRSRQYFERLWCQQCGIQTNQTWLLKWGTINVLSTFWIVPLNIIIVHSYAVFSHINFGFIIFSHSIRKHLDVLIIILGKKLPSDTSRVLAEQVCAHGQWVTFLGMRATSVNLKTKIPCLQNFDATYPRVLWT